MKKKIALSVYYILLVLIALFFIRSGYSEITKNPATFPKNVDEMGYPPYFIVALGYLKFLGSVVFFISIIAKNKWLVRLTEWALLCLLFDVFFAFISEVHIDSRAGIIRAIVVFIVLVITFLLHLYWIEKFFRKRENDF